MPRKIKALARIVLDDQPCCLEFSQAETDYFVVGTYTLQTDDDNGGGDGGNYGEEDNDGSQQKKQTICVGARATVASVDDDAAKTAAAAAAEPEAEMESAVVSSSSRQRRRGSLLLFRLDNVNPTPIQTIDCSGGVLDLHFSPHRPELLACALDCGMVAVYVLRRQQQQQQQATPQSSPGVCLAHMHSLSLGQPQSLVSTPTPTVLAVAWHPQLPDVLAASLDTGTVEVLRLGRLKDGCGGDGGHAGDNDVVEDDSSAGGGGLKEQHEDSMQALHSGLNAHAFHAWTVAFAPLNTRAWWQQPQQQRGEQPPPQPFIIYSGGDDATTRASVFAAPNPSSLGEAHPGVTIRKLHQSGVTAVVPLPPPAPPQYSASPANTAATPPPPSLSSLPANAPPDAPHQLLLTGSYDEYVRIVDASAKTVLAETCLGTGVWRLKIVACFAGEGVAEPEGDYHASQSPQRPGIVVVYIVLACCLAGGARVLRIERSPADDNDQWAIRVTDEFTGHASLNYAGDVQPLRKNGRAKDRKKREAEEMKEGKDVAEVVDVEVDPLENETAATHVAGQTFRCATTGFYDKSLCIWDFSI